MLQLATTPTPLEPALRRYFGPQACLDRRLRHIEGTHRTRSVSETLASIGGRLADLGVSRVIDLTPLDRIGLPVFNVCIPNRFTECYTAGKGITREACLVSGLMEAFEIRCATARHPRYELCGVPRARAQEHGEALDPNTLLLPVEGQFDDAQRLDWFRCLELSSQREAYLPADLFGFAYGKANGSTRTTPYVNTNGLASGNSVHEAIVHALLELVERDGLVLSNFGAPRPIAVPDHGLSPALDSLLARLRAVELELLVFDISTDIGLPTYQAYLVDACGFGEYHLHCGMGCHLDPHVALSRAVTEACQVRLTYFAGARNDVADASAGEDAYRALLACHAEAPARPLPDAAAPITDLGDVLDDVQGRLAAVGCDEVWVANLSQPGFEQLAVSCYVPGLEGLCYDEQGQLAVGERGWQWRQRHGARRFGF
ncbi:MAG: YcaO-like family protein [Deltaproteobacteria bacterium]|nr:YcaO-like family protein [Deltaproteobacteria bacterium]